MAAQVGVRRLEGGGQYEGLREGLGYCLPSILRCNNQCDEEQCNAQRWWLGVELEAGWQKRVVIAGRLQKLDQKHSHTKIRLHFRRVRHIAGNKRTVLACKTFHSVYCLSYESEETDRSKLRMCHSLAYIVAGSC